MPSTCPRCERPSDPDAAAGDLCAACLAEALDPARLEVVDLGERTGAPPRRADPVVEPHAPAFAPPSFTHPDEQTFELDPAWEAERRATQQAAQRPPPRTGPGPAGVIVAVLLIALVTAALVYVVR